MKFVKRQKICVEIWQLFRVDQIEQTYYYGVKEFRSGLRRKGDAVDSDTLAMYLSLDNCEREQVIRLIDDYVQGRRSDGQQSPFAQA